MRFATAVSTRIFDAKAEKLITHDERADLEFALAHAPEAHPVVPGLNGVRKALGQAIQRQTGRRAGCLLLRDQRRGRSNARHLRKERKGGFDQ